MRILQFKFRAVKWNLRSRRWKEPRLSPPSAPSSSPILSSISSVLYSEHRALTYRGDLCVSCSRKDTEQLKISQKWVMMEALAPSSKVSFHTAIHLPTAWGYIPLPVLNTISKCHPTPISAQVLLTEINIREGNGNPLQCSCLETPGDGGAW